MGDILRGRKQYRSGGAGFDEEFVHVPATQVHSKRKVDGKYDNQDKESKPEPKTPTVVVALEKVLQSKSKKKIKKKSKRSESKSAAVVTKLPQEKDLDFLIREISKKKSKS